jgi:soluble P-type ATPase
VIATGDTSKAAQNIARVLCPLQTENMMTVRALDSTEVRFPYENLSKNSVIFAGINDFVLKQLDRLMTLNISERPNIIFSEMTTQDKGILTSYFKKRGYFTVANGDGSNDIAMMKEADLVIGHLSDEGSYAPGISQYVNINDKQIQKICHKIQSCYELLDIHQREKSQFILPFISLANAQEMVSYALLFKTIKMSMELSKALDFDVNEIFQQQILSILFDLSWLWISLKIILENSHLPVHHQHLGKAWLPLKCMFATISVSVLESFICYQLLGQTTDFTFLLLKLAFLPVGLTSFFNGFHAIQNELPPLNKDEQQILQIKLDKKPSSYLPLKTSMKSFSLLKKQKGNSRDEMAEQSEKKRCCIIL